MLNNSQGFTLIEVLIAAVILFAAVGLTSELFNSSLLFSNNASASARFYQTHPVSMSAIKTEIRELYLKKPKDNLNGLLTISGIRYQWQAKRQAYKTRPSDGSEERNLEKRFSLYKVSVEASKAGKSDQFEFYVVAW